MSRYIVQTASAKMPASCKGIYRKVAVLEVNDGVERASMISDRSKDVIKIVTEEDRLHVGKTERAAYQRALARAEALCAKLNAEQKKGANAIVVTSQAKPPVTTRIFTHIKGAK